MTRLLPSLRRAAPAVALVAGNLAFAHVASASSVGPAKVTRPPALMPVDFPGVRGNPHARIPKGHVVVRRVVTLTRQDRPFSYRFRCPSGRVIRSLAGSDSGRVAFRLAGAFYVNRPYVDLDFFPIFPPGQTVPDPRAYPVHSSFYLLCRKRT